MSEKLFEVRAPWAADLKWFLRSAEATQLRRQVDPDEPVCPCVDERGSGALSREERGGRNLAHPGLGMATVLAR